MNGVAGWQPPHEINAGPSQFTTSLTLRDQGCVGGHDAGKVGLKFDP